VLTLPRIPFADGVGDLSPASRPVFA
jgi:hypothetical protein